MKYPVGGLGLNGGAIQKSNSQADKEHFLNVEQGIMNVEGTEQI